MPRPLTYTRRKHGQPPRRAPELLCCPNCGYDLKKAEPVRYGDLFADPRGDTFWKGKLVKLSPNQRIVLHTLLTGKPPRSANRDWEPGSFVDRITIAERVDTTADTVDVVISNLRKAFRQVDPEFNHIETQFGEGYRWSAIKVPKPIARWGSGTFVLYDNGELVWRQRYRIFLSPQETAVMKVLLEAGGNFIKWPQINAAIGSKTDSAARAAVNRLRQRFKEADPNSIAVHCDAPGRWSRGYRIVKPDFVPEPRNERQKKYAERRATGWKPTHSREKQASGDQAR